MTGNFLVVAMGSVSASPLQYQMLVSTWDAELEEFGSWIELTTTSERVDKGWLVLGKPGAETKDPGLSLSAFYIVWVDTQSEPNAPGNDFSLDYRRSRDGGETWVGGDALFDLDDPNSVVSSHRGWPLPRVYESRPVYVAHVNDAGYACEREIRIVRGDDVNTGAHAGEVEFTELIDHATSQPISILLNAGPRVSEDRLPGRDLLFLGSGVGVGVDMAVDPTNANKLYLVYHDTSVSCSEQYPPVDTDLNIYMRTLTKDTGDRWTVGAQTVVSAPATERETDQFMPQVVVDSRGHLHAIYYSDEKYGTAQNDQLDGAENVKFDVWYAYSNDGGSTWTRQELCEYATNDCVGADPDPAIDSSLTGANDEWLRDYIGIAAGSNDVWTSFMGITDDDASDDKSVIWSTRITRQ